MKIFRNILVLLCITSSLLLISCKRERYGCTDPRANNYNATADIDDGTCSYLTEYYYGDCFTTNHGNLIIKNLTGERLFLYNNYTEGSNVEDAFQNCIPPDTTDFLINVPNNELAVCLLQIWKESDMEDQYTPNLDNVYRQWNVALSNTTLPNERVTWLITDSDNVSGTGTLLLNYADMDKEGHPVIYQVDVLLNSKNGARLASLQPGVVNKRVSVDYGVQYLYHHYWYSDPNSTSGAIQDIGWAQTNEIVINESHQQATIEIPAFTSNIGKYGFITVDNPNPYVVNVYANSLLIENIALVEGSSQGLSSIPSGSQTTFKVPVDKYSIQCKQLDGSNSVSLSDVSVIQDENTLITTGGGYRNIKLVNNTNIELGLFTIDEEFLGLIVDHNKQSADYTIPASYDTLLVMDFARTRSKGISYQPVVTVNNLDYYVYNRIVMETPWSLVDEVYQSPIITDNSATTMVATMLCAEDVVLTFEYNVSSETGYDKFSFYADGIEELGNVTGETGWGSFSKTFAPGTYSLIWKYEKDQSRSEGRDNVLIKNILLN